VVDPVSFDGAQHLVSMAVGESDLENSRSMADMSRWPPGSADPAASPAGGSRPARLGDVRGRLARLLNALSVHRRADSVRLCPPAWSMEL